MLLAHKRLKNEYWKKLYCGIYKNKHFKSNFRSFSYFANFHLEKFIIIEILNWTSKIRLNVFIPQAHTSVLVDIGIRTNELDHIGIYL